MAFLTNSSRVFACILLLLGSAQSFAQENQPNQNPANPDPLTLNMQDADIGALIESVSYVTGKNFIVDPRVTGRVTIVSALPTDKEDIYDLFLSVLRVYGYAAVEAGNVVKIVPDASAKFEDVPELGQSAGINDAVSTLVIKLENASATDLIPILRPLMPQSAHLAAHNDSNMLIAADTAANLDRLRRIIKRIDLDDDQSIEVIRLQYANASDLVQVLLPAYQAQTGAGKGKKGTSTNEVNLVADDRTNSILLSGDKSDRLEIRTLITHLDTPVEQAGDTEVIYLKYAVASELVPILQRLGGRLGVTSEEQQQNNKVNSAGSGETLFEIEADDNMNALIIYAPPKRLQAVKSVIRQLDIRRAQVLVEGVIAEVSYDKSIELGVQWQTNIPTDNGFSAGSSQSGADLLAEGISGFDPLSLGVGLSLGFFRDGSLRGLIRAIKGDGYSNILSTPTLMTMDNEEAEIVIGQNVPFITGQFTNATTTAQNPFQTIERQDVGILLKVKPQINEGNSVKLEIEQEISSIDASTQGTDLITNKRSIKTNVLVDDKKIIVLGGLLEDDLRENQNKVPVLGDIPLVGNLFRNTRDERVKTNLMIFLRPQIVRDERTSSNLTISKYNFIRNEQKKLQKDGITLMPSTRIQELPDFDSVKDSSQEFIMSEPLDIIDEYE